MSNRQSTLLLGYGDAEHFSAAVCLFFYLVSILYIYIHLTEFKQSNIRMTFIYTHQVVRVEEVMKERQKTEQKEQNQERKKRRRTDTEKIKEMEEKKHKREKRNREKKGR